MIRPRIKIAYARRGRRLASSPAITKIDGTHFSILWRGPKPLEWAVQTQGEQGGEWDINTVVPGNVMVVTLSGAPFAVRIVGRDADRNPVTGVSNVLVMNPGLPAPVLTFDSANNLWSIACTPVPYEWQILKRCDSSPDWFTQGWLTSDAMPCPTSTVLAGDEVWWQVKFIGCDDSDHPITPESNVVSSPNVPP